LFRYKSKTRSSAQFGFTATSARPSSGRLFYKKSVIRFSLRFAGASRSALSRPKWATYAVAGIVFVAVFAVEVNSHLKTGSSTSVAGATSQQISIDGSLITPPTSLPDAPPILIGEPFGARLTDINIPLNSTELAVINDAPDSYFVTAAQMYLNGSLGNTVGITTHASPPFIVNGKPTVIYLGAISCADCAENRWAMALALSRFGSFQQLFKGYSAIDDGDVPTIYWAPAHYNVTQGVDFGNFYTSKYINFLAIDYDSQVTQGYAMAPLSYFQQQAATLGNTAYAGATSILIGLNDYAGTPDTVWGSYSVPGADAINFGPTTAAPYLTTVLPISSMTHDQILASFANPSTSFAWIDYAAADYYVALVCASGNVSAPVCSLPSISTMVAQVPR